MILFLCRSADHKNLKTVRVCPQVTVQRIAVNTAALGGSAVVLPPDSEGEDVDSAERGSTILSARDYALLDETKGADLKWKPSINKSTKAKKGAKQNAQKNPTTNPKQAARAHKNNLLLYQITSYAASYWSLVSFLKSHNVYSRRLFSKNNKQRKKLRRLLCRKNKERKKLRRLLECASRKTNQRQKLRRSYNAHRQTRAHMHFLWHDGFFNVFLILSALYMWCYGHLRFLFLNHIEGDWRWRWWDLGKPPEADQVHPFESVR